MDTSVDDKMYKQIEKNLANSMNDHLFEAGTVYWGKQSANSKLFDVSEEEKVTASSLEEATYASQDYVNQPLPVSRAEYIKQAREACLRQLSETQLNSRYVEAYQPTAEAMDLELGNKKSKLRMFHNTEKEEETEQDIASFRFLIIRTVCAIVLFLSIFIIDKFEIKIGSFTPQTIQEYVTGNDTLENIESFVVSLIK